MGHLEPLQKSVLQYQRIWQEKMEAGPVHFMKRILPTAIKEAKAKLGSFVGADEKDLNFVQMPLWE